MSEESSEVPAKRNRSEEESSENGLTEENPRLKPLGKAARAKVTRPVEEDPESSFDPSEESEDPLPDLLSDEGEHGDDSDFDINDYIRFKEEEEGRERDRERTAKQSAEDSGGDDDDENSLSD